MVVLVFSLCVWDYHLAHQQIQAKSRVVWFDESKAERTLSLNNTGQQTDSQHLSSDVRRTPVTGEGMAQFEPRLELQEIHSKDSSRRVFDKLWA